MGLLVIVLFAAAWASILLPGEYRARRKAAGTKSAFAFERTMSMLAHHRDPPAPAGRRGLVLDDPAMPSGMRRHQRAALVQLGIVASVSGGLAVLAGGLLWVAFGVSAVALAGYALVVARMRALQAEHRQKVRPIVAPERQGEAGDDIQRWVG
ncbi:MAG: hypothetical protein ACRD0K_05515 [Egibacteraceae bacterium]